MLSKDAAAATTMTGFGFMGKMVLWAVVTLLVLENLGIDVTTLIGMLGIGGIAIGLAVKDIIGDLLASISIVVDKPFVIGEIPNA